MRQSILDRLLPITPEEQEYLNGGRADMSRYSRGSGHFDQSVLLPPGHLIGLRPHARFVHFPSHSHNYVELVYMAQGRTTHIIDGRDRVELKAGSLLFLNQTVTHEIEPAGRTDLALNFIILPRFFDAAAASLDAESPLWLFLMGTAQSRHAVPGYLVYDVGDSIPIQNLLENLVLLLQTGGSENGEVERQTMSLLLLHLAHYTDRLMVRTKAEKQHAMVMRALQYIEDNYRVCSLAELADREQMSEWSMSRLLHSETGCTFTELTQTVRFSRAAKLLRSTDMSIAEISEAIGYENAGFFYRHFARRFGCTPKAYRLGSSPEQRAAESATDEEET